MCYLWKRLPLHIYATFTLNDLTCERYHRSEKMGWLDSSDSKIGHHLNDVFFRCTTPGAGRPAVCDVGVYFRNQQRTVLWEPLALTVDDLQPSFGYRVWPSRLFNRHWKAVVCIVVAVREIAHPQYSWCIAVVFAAIATGRRKPITVVRASQNAFG